MSFAGSDLGAVVLRPALPGGHADGNGRSDGRWARGRVVARLRDLAELTKARLSALVLVTVGAGFLLAGGGALAQLIGAVLGAGLAALGAGALNQWWEVEHDRRMLRTRARPLPAGRMASGEALAVGLGLSLAGPLLVAAVAGPLPALLTVATGALYVLAYTPLKRRTPLSLIPGALVGALPPLIGWSAAGAPLSEGAWFLFAVLVLWQVPHVVAIDWVHREDYGRGGYKTFSRRDPSGRTNGALAAFGSAALALVSLSGPSAGLGGPISAPISSIVGLLLGGVLFGFAVHFRLTRTTEAAQRLFLVSLIHLPLLLILLVLESGTVTRL